MSLVTTLSQFNTTWENARNGLMVDLQRIANGVNDTITTCALDTFADDWIDVTFSTTLFSCNPAGSITPKLARPYSVCYKVIATRVMFLNVAFTVLINNTGTTEVRLKVPGGYIPRTLPSIGQVDENRHQTAGMWSGGGTAGVAGLFINVAGRYVSFQRWDGAPAAAYPNATTCVFGGMVVIPLAA